MISSIKIAVVMALCIVVTNVHASDSEPPTVKVKNYTCNYTYADRRAWTRYEKALKVCSCVLEPPITIGSKNILTSVNKDAVVEQGLANIGFWNWWYSFEGNSGSKIVISGPFCTG